MSRELLLQVVGYRFGASFVRHGAAAHGGPVRQRSLLRSTPHPLASWAALQTASALPSVAFHRSPSSPSPAALLPSLVGVSATGVAFAGQRLSVGGDVTPALRPSAESPVLTVARTHLFSLRQTPQPNPALNRTLRDRAAQRPVISTLCLIGASSPSAFMTSVSPRGSIPTV